ncbi:MAG TPA: hypothetical protein VLA43_17485, partial [Longimicrobiales bacterium]|nr:hypothetical protein [Longimicrobiales bacterium]
MILELVGFVLATSLVTGAAAWIGDRGLRRAGWPTRWIWLSALAAPWALLAAPLLPLPSASSAGVLDGALVLRLPGLVVDGGGGSAIGGWLPAAVGLLWGVSSLVLGVALTRGHRKLLRDRRGWEERRIAGRRVFLSDDLGPAVAGVTRPWIVLPRWALDLPDRWLDLVVLHEEEHVRAGDGLLLAGAF